MEQKHTPEELLELVRAEATKFGRCCDLSQDGLGQFADFECTQRTFAMMKGVQSVLGFNKACGPLTDEEITAARANAKLHKAAPDMLRALEEIAKGEGAFNRDPLKHAENCINSIIAISKAAIHKARGEL